MKKSLVLICLLTSLSMASFLVPNVHAVATRWALIVCGTYDLQEESRLLYHTLDKLHFFIYYLHENIHEEGVNGFASIAEIRRCLDFLKRDSDQYDSVFIYFMCHGGGIWAREGFPEPPELIGGRVEVSWDDQGKPAYSDEGNEITEFAMNCDFNNDGDMNDWLGVDECLWLPSFEQYWDDELAADLVGLKCNVMAITIVACFGGGFIDDLSGPNRIIMTPTNETSYAWAKIDEKGNIFEMSSWGYYFVSALDPSYTHADLVDPNHDGVTLKEAFDWAWQNDPIRQTGLETPWLDDNGDGLPTYMGMSDLYGTPDGSLASNYYMYYCHQSGNDC